MGFLAGVASRHGQRQESADQVLHGALRERAAAAAAVHLGGAPVSAEGGLLPSHRGAIGDFECTPGCENRRVVHSSEGK